MQDWLQRPPDDLIVPGIVIMVVAAAIMTFVMIEFIDLIDLYRNDRSRRREIAAKLEAIRKSSDIPPNFYDRINVLSDELKKAIDDWDKNFHRDGH